MYVIKRIDGRGGYVARHWSALAGSYTDKLQNARTFPTHESAERERCPGNEIIVPVRDEMEGL